MSNNERDAQREREWPLFEIFIRPRGGLDHKHVGSLHACDPRMAIEHARDLYTRREEGDAFQQAFDVRVIRGIF